MVSAGKSSESHAAKLIICFMFLQNNNDVLFIGGRVMNIRSVIDYATA